MHVFLQNHYEDKKQIHVHYLEKHFDIYTPLKEKKESEFKEVENFEGFAAFGIMPFYSFMNPLPLRPLFGEYT